MTSSTWLTLPKLPKRLRSLSPSRSLEIHSKHTGNCLQLEWHEIRSIQRSWGSVTDCKGVILAAYEEIFEHRPDLLSHYKLHGVHPAASAHFGRHVSGIGAFLDLVVDELGGKHPQNLLTIVRDVGVFHAKIGVPFTAGDLLLYKMAILRQIFPSGDLFDPVYFAWLRLLTFVVIEMKCAFKNGQSR